MKQRWYYKTIIKKAVAYSKYLVERINAFITTENYDISGSADYRFHRVLAVSLQFR